MRARGHVVGLLLLLSTAEQPVLDEDDRRLAEDLAARSALAIDNARLYAEQLELAEHLQIALSSSTAIEQAKGMLAAREGIPTGEAFDRMRRHARSRRMRVDEVAEGILTGAHDLR